MTRKNVVLVICLLIIVSFNMAKASVTVNHICPLSSEKNLSYKVDVHTSVIKKEICNIDEIDSELLEKAMSGEVITKVLDTDKKKQMNFIMMAFIPAEFNDVADLIIDLNSLDQLIRSANKFEKFEINNIDELSETFKDYASLYNDIDIESSQFYRAKYTFGSGFFKVKDKIIRHQMNLENISSRSIVSNLIESKEVFGSSFSTFKVFPYEGGTIMINYSEDYLKHPSAGMVMKKVKKGAIESAHQFTADISNMLNNRIQD